MNSSSRRVVRFAGLVCLRRVLTFCVVMGLGWRAVAAPPKESTRASVADLPTSFSAAPVLLPPQTNGDAAATAAVTSEYERRLADALVLEKTGQEDKAEPTFIHLLGEAVPEKIQRTALFELGAVVRMENDLPRAESICAQFLDRWPDDPRIPELFLRQGQMYREMGLNSLALTKFYAVMTAALSLKSDQPDYYPNLVLEAQTEIAETHYLMGRFGDAAEFYSRLLKQGSPALNRPQAQYRLIRSLVASDRYDEAASQERGFLSYYPDSPEQPEVRFYLAQTLKKQGQNNEALEQVLLLLREQKAKTADHPEVWAYWQQRAGNEVANQLYHDGDYLGALSIYVSLASLDAAPVWQLPVQYQIGLTYERLEQPQKAVEAYNAIIKLEPAMGTNASPGQKAVIQMARWRAGFLNWRGRAETTDRALATAAPQPGRSLTNNPPPVSTP